MRQVANDRQLARTHAIQLSGINFEMHNPCVRSEAGRLTRHAVIEARAENQQQVGFIQRQVRRPRAVHPDHSQVIGPFRTDCAQAVDGREGWNLQMIQNSAEVGYGARQLDSRAH